MILSAQSGEVCLGVVSQQQEDALPGDSVEVVGWSKYSPVQRWDHFVKREKGGVGR